MAVSQRKGKVTSQQVGESAGNVNRVVVVGHGFMPTQADLNLAARIWSDLNPSFKIRGCPATTVECPIGTRVADLLAQMKKGDWGLAVLGKYFKENVLAGDKIEYSEFEKENGQQIGIIVSRR